MKHAIAAFFIVAGMGAFARAQTAAPATQDEMSSNEATTEASTQEAMDAEPATAPTTQSALAPGQPTTRPVNRVQRYTAPTQAYGRNRRFGNRQNNNNGGSSPLSTTTPQPGVMSADFAVLTTRSIFIRGSQFTSTEVNSNPRPIIDYSPNIPQPERSLVFNGVTKSDAAVAMIENMDTHEISRLRVGDVIARGKIVAITLNSMDYDSNGRVTRIELGQNLAGGTVATVAGELSAAPIAGSTTQPAGPVTRQLGESIEAYMRRRRAAGF